MRFIFLMIGTLLTLLLIPKVLGGKKYDYMTENLDSGEFPLSGLYCIGFAWNEGSLLALKGKMRETLIAQAKLLYGPMYAEYYATVAWAQTITFVHLGLAFGFVLAGALNNTLMLVIGLAAAGLFGFYFLNHMADVLKDREAACTAELPEIVSTMALLIGAGMMMREAWRVIAMSKEGMVYDLMRKACDDMENGMSDVDAIHKFGRLSNSNEVRKFAGALAQSMELGGSELTDFLTKQSGEMWVLKKQLMLQKGEAAASKLLMPTVMLFVAIIIAVFSGAIGMLI